MRPLLGSGTLHSMGLPIHVYPLYENGRRAHRGLSAAESAAESAKMYAEFDRIGSENVYSWNYRQPPKTAEQIGLVSKKNRMICDPCNAASISPPTKESRDQANALTRSPADECLQRRQLVGGLHPHLDGTRKEAWYSPRPVDLCLGRRGHARKGQL